MGLIRKTLSVGTLGVVSFRGKKEKLRRAERSQRDAETALEQEHAARASAEDRIAAAEKRVKKAHADAADVAKQLEKTKRSSRHARKSGSKTKFVAEMISAAEPIVRSQIETARHAGGEALERGRKSSRRARKHAERTAKSAHATVAPHAEKVVAKAAEVVEQLTPG